jgi:hypothetical protein
MLTLEDAAFPGCRALLVLPGEGILTKLVFEYHLEQRLCQIGNRRHTADWCRPYWRRFVPFACACRPRAIIIRQRKRPRFLFRQLRSRGASIKAAAGAAFSDRLAQVLERGLGTG